MLCPGDKIGGVIGKGGSIIKSLRQNTRAKIKVADGIPGVDERVIIIFSSPKERKSDRDDEDDDSAKQATTRLLVLNNQIGCLLGRGGKVIEKMRTDIGA